MGKILICMGMKHEREIRQKETENTAKNEELMECVFLFRVNLPDTGFGLLT
jgi:hypothetical protein